MKGEANHAFLIYVRYLFVIHTFWGQRYDTKTKNGRNSVIISSILQLFVDYYIKATNSLSLIMVSLGHETVLKTSKCLSLVTMSSASAAIAQSTNLLSSGSSVIRPKTVCIKDDSSHSDKEYACVLHPIFLSCRC